MKEKRIFESFMDAQEFSSRNNHNGDITIMRDINGMYIVGFDSSGSTGRWNNLETSLEKKIRIRNEKIDLILSEV